MTFGPTSVEPRLQEVARTQSIEHKDQPSLGIFVNHIVMQTLPLWSVIWWRFLELDARARGLQFSMKLKQYFKQKLLDDVTKSCPRSSDDFLVPLAIPHSSSSDSFQPCRTTLFRNQIMDSYWHISPVSFKVNFEVKVRALRLVSNVASCMLTYRTQTSRSLHKINIHREVYTQILCFSQISVKILRHEEQNFVRLL